MLLGALWLASCGAPNPIAGDSEPEQEWPEPSPALWEVTSPDGKTGWLFGTIHALPDGVTWRTEVLDQVIGNADRLLVEIDLRESSGASESFQRRALANTGRRLLDRLPASDRDEIEALLLAANREADDFYHVDTWAAALQLGNALRCSEAGNGVDRALLAEVRPVQEVESYGSQFAMFDSLSASAQADLLLTIAEERDCASGEGRTRDWLIGDVDAMLASVESGFRGNAELRQSLLVDRNVNFARSFEDALHQEPDRRILLAIGAAHIPGPDGVAAMLEREGYSVRRIQ